MGIPENKTLEDRGALKIQNPRGPRTLKDPGLWKILNQF